MHRWIRPRVCVAWNEIERVDLFFDFRLFALMLAVYVTNPAQFSRRLRRPHPELRPRGRRWPPIVLPLSFLGVRPARLVEEIQKRSSVPIGPKLKALVNE